MPCSKSHKKLFLWRGRRRKSKLIITLLLPKWVGEASHCSIAVGPIWFEEKNYCIISGWARTMCSKSVNCIWIIQTFLVKCRQIIIILQSLTGYSRWHFWCSWWYCLEWYTWSRFLLKWIKKDSLSLFSYDNDSCKQIIRPIGLIRKLEACGIKPGSTWVIMGSSAAKRHKKRKKVAPGRFGQCRRFFFLLKHLKWMNVQTGGVTLFTSKCW